MTLGMLWLTCHNPEIDWRMGEVKMNKIFREVWKVGEVRIAEAKERREKRRREELRRKEAEEGGRKKEKEE